MIEFIRAATEEEVYDIVDNGVVIGFIKKTDNETFPWLMQYRNGDQNFQLSSAELEEGKGLLKQILTGSLVLEDLPKLKMGKQDEPRDEVQESESKWKH